MAKMSQMSHQMSAALARVRVPENRTVLRSTIQPGLRVEAYSGVRFNPPTSAALKCLEQDPLPTSKHPVTTIPRSEEPSPSCWLSFLSLKMVGGLNLNKGNKGNKDKKGAKGAKGTEYAAWSYIRNS